MLAGVDRWMNSPGLWPGGLYLRGPLLSMPACVLAFPQRVILLAARHDYELPKPPPIRYHFGLNNRG